MKKLAAAIAFLGWFASAQAQIVTTSTSSVGFQVLAEQGMAIIYPSSGSMGDNGALTLNVALLNAYSNAYIYLPANAIATGSAEGLYFVQMSSTTVGTVFNNILSGAPTVPASPTPFATTGPGAFVTATGAEKTLLSITIPANSMGPNGALRINSYWSYNNSGNNKITIARFAGNALWSSTNTTTATFSTASMFVRNRGVTNRQVIPQSAFFLSFGGSTGTPDFLSVDTTSNQTLTYSVNMAAVTDFTVLEGSTLEELYR